MSNNKAVLVEVNQYGDIDENFESTDFLHGSLTSGTYMLQEYSKSDKNKLENGELVYNYIYTYPKRPKPYLYVDQCKRQNM